MAIRCRWWVSVGNRFTIDEKVCRNRGRASTNFMARSNTTRIMALSILLAQRSGAVARQDVLLSKSLIRSSVAVFRR